MMQGYCNHSLIEVLNCQPFWIISAVLALLCLAYNRLIDLVFEAGYERDTTVWFVVGGVLMVLIGFAVIYGVDAALVAFFLFSGTGLVMIVGAFRRNASKTAEDREALQKATKSINNRGSDG